MKRLGIIGTLVLCLSLGGCKQQPAVLNALAVIGQLLTLAQDDLPSLQVSGVITSGDQVAFGNWLAAGQTLLTQAQTCVSGLGASGSGSALASCVNTFATGLLSPTEQAQLRIISPAAQKKVTLYVTAIVLATNFAAQLINANQSTTPPVGSTAGPAPTSTELRELRIRLNLSPAYGL